MREVVNLWGDVIETQLEMDDVIVGREYIGNRRIDPKYLQNSKLTVLRKGKKNVICNAEEYGQEEFPIRPFMLSSY